MRCLGDAALTHADVMRLEYTTQVIQEGLRLYPPFWMIDRMAMADDRVGRRRDPTGVDGDCVCVWGASCGSCLGERPESFDPERFARTNDKPPAPFTYIPFGGGPRGCIGGNYAMLQILMILSVVLRRYDLHLTPGQTITPRPMVILRPKDGIRMSFSGTVRPDASTAYAAPVAAAASVATP